MDPMKKWLLDLAAALAADGEPDAAAAILNGVRIHGKIDAFVAAGNQPPTGSIINSVLLGVGLAAGTALK
jgi:hypothetical protein